MTVAERFEAKVDRTPGHGPWGDCHLWQGATSGGYGQIRVGGKLRGAHVVAWEIANGRAVPPGKRVLHTCDIKPCVNAAHLSLGDAGENQWQYRDRTLGQRRLTVADVHAMRTAHERGASISALARTYRVSWNTASSIVKHRTWRDK